MKDAAWMEAVDAADGAFLFAAVGARSYMRGYRDIYHKVGPLFKLMIRFCDSVVKMKIIRIRFREAAARNSRA